MLCTFILILLIDIVFAIFILSNLYLTTFVVVTSTAILFYVCSLIGDVDGIKHWKPKYNTIHRKYNYNGLKGLYFEKQSEKFIYSYYKYNIECKHSQRVISGNREYIIDIDDLYDYIIALEKAKKEEN